MATKSILIGLALCMGIVHQARADDGHMTVYQKPGCNDKDAAYLKYDLTFPEGGGGGTDCTKVSVFLLSVLFHG
jgi:hypothetical protein